MGDNSHLLANALFGEWVTRKYSRTSRKGDGTRKHGILIIIFVCLSKFKFYFHGVVFPFSVNVCVCMCCFIFSLSYYAILYAYLLPSS